MMEHKVMVFELGGNRSECVSEHGNKCSSYWYLKPEELQDYINNGTYDKDEVEGCILLDIRRILKKNPYIVMKEPICDPTLPDGTIDKFDVKLFDDPVTKSIAKSFSEGGGTLAVASALYGGLDKVPISTYVEWWRKNGAKVGVVKDGKVTWED